MPDEIARSCIRFNIPRVESAFKAMDPPNTASAVLHCETCRGKAGIFRYKNGKVETDNDTPYCRLREVLGK